MNIFITGATGFIGGRLLDRLCSVLPPHDRIFVLSRTRTKFGDRRITVVHGTLEDITNQKEIVQNCEYIYHLAANPTFGNDVDYDKTNYEPVVNLVAMIQKSSCLRNFIFVSTIGAVDRAPGDRCSEPLDQNSTPHPTSAYGRSKFKAESCLANSSIPYTIIRPTWVYGRDMRSNSHINTFVSMVYKKTLFAHLNFPGKVSLIHNDDLSLALVNCIGNDRVIRKTYFAETEVLSIGMLFRIIYRKIYGRDLAQVPVPRMHWVMGRIHRWLPVPLSNLFLDYLCAADRDFKQDLSIQVSKEFHLSVDDVIITNVHNGAWVVTGANSGIGFALARQLDVLGKNLILIDLNVENLGSFTKHQVLQADLGDYREIIRITGMLADCRICCVINNAGVGFRGSVLNLSIEQIQKTIDVNVAYPILFVKSLLPNLLRDQSVIVNIASSVAYNPLPHMSVYSASKAFLSNWSESLSFELRKTNKVITIAPSGTYTNFQKEAGVRVEQGGKGLLAPDDVAREIIKAVSGNKPFIILGAKSKVLIVISRFLPKRFAILLWGKLFEKYR